MPIIIIDAKGRFFIFERIIRTNFKYFDEPKVSSILRLFCHHSLPAATSSPLRRTFPSFLPHTSYGIPFNQYPMLPHTAKHRDLNLSISSRISTSSPFSRERYIIRLTNGHNDARQSSYFFLFFQISVEIRHFPQCVKRRGVIEQIMMKNCR